MERKNCRHCRVNKVVRPRGLCWSCFHRPGVRDMYPSTSKYARRGVQDRTSSRDTLPAEATDAKPGTAEKVAVMEQRARRGEALHHPHDARLAVSLRERVYRLMLGVNYAA